MSYDNTGKVSLWAQKKAKEGAPVFKGKLYAHRAYQQGEEIEIALWSNPKANPQRADYNSDAPRFTGKVQDKWVNPRQSGTQSRDDYDRSQAGGPQSAEDVVKDFDDSIPW